MQRVSPFLTAVCRLRISRQQLFERLLSGVCRAGRVGEQRGRGRGLAQLAVLVSFRVPQMQKMQVARWYDSHAENCRYTPVGLCMSHRPRKLGEPCTHFDR